MAASKGRSFLLKMGDGAGSEVFTTIAGSRSLGFSSSRESVNVTTKDSAGVRQLLAAAGESSVQVSIDGVFTDSAIEDTFRANHQAGTLHNFQIIDADTGDKWQGAFQITQYNRNAGYNDMLVYSATLESSGAINFTAA